MTITVKTTDGIPRLENRADASFTSTTLSAEAARAYGHYLQMAATREFSSADEAAILMTPDVVAAFDDARPSLDAWKQAL